MPMDWSRFEHAYGSAADLPQLLEQVGDPELADEAWEELASALYHQGSVYTASFAALPALADIAADRIPGDRRLALLLAGRIVSAEQQVHEPGYVQTHYPDAVAELHGLTLQGLRAEPFEGDEEDYLYALEDLLAFEGVPVWRCCLLRNSYEVQCPACSQHLKIDLYAQPPCTRRLDPNERVRFIGDQGPPLTGIHPTVPADLPPLGARLYAMAVEAGQSTVAEHLTHLHGRATCPDCTPEFSVPQQIEAAVRSRTPTLRATTNPACHGEQ
ncbi:hypothetical protein G9272_08550 [Streptomyces asoensis]|uniref:Uncharacterized protein n=1 Tax=Streptomyces asoensis TaxID=249586 RepID=A0A6M4WIB0_9ACTN|nr:hypothetical protein [Streptomyces asoensis]QJT00330.1 hypothetical protein G9272_08550 [Streptomyces asoensis]